MDPKLKSAPASLCGEQFLETEIFCQLMPGHKGEHYSRGIAEHGDGTVTPFEIRWIPDRLSHND